MNTEDFRMVFFSLFLLFAAVVAAHRFISHSGILAILPAMRVFDKPQTNNPIAGWRMSEHANNIFSCV